MTDNKPIDTSVINIIVDESEDIECVSTQSIEFVWITYNKGLVSESVGVQLYIDGEKATNKDFIDELIQNCGFNNRMEFFTNEKWYGKDFKGKIIHFTNLEYKEDYSQEEIKKLKEKMSNSIETKTPDEIIVGQTYMINYIGWKQVVVNEINGDDILVKSKEGNGESFLVKKEKIKINFLS